MSEPEQISVAMIERLAALMGVPLAPEYLAGVVANFENFRALYETVRDGEASDVPDPPGIFRP